MSDLDLRPWCDGCGKKHAVCWHHHEGPRSWLCNDCCGHSGEEGSCYHWLANVPMDEYGDDEIAEMGEATP